MMVAVVYGRVEETSEPVGTWRHDLGERPKMRAVKVARAGMWINAGTPEDVAKAKTWAAREGYTVLVFPSSEPDPLRAARKALEEGWVPA